MTLNTIALELVPPNVERSPERALEEARKVLQFCGESGIEGRIGHMGCEGARADPGQALPAKRRHHRLARHPLAIGAQISQHPWRPVHAVGGGMRRGDLGV